MLEVQSSLSEEQRGSVGGAKQQTELSVNHVTVRVSSEAVVLTGGRSYRNADIGKGADWVFFPLARGNSRAFHLAEWAETWPLQCNARLEDCLRLRVFSRRTCDLCVECLQQGREEKRESV